MSTVPESKRVIGQRAYETQLLADRLLKTQPGELVSYEELSKIAGMDVRPGGPGYGRLGSARNIALCEGRILLEPVAGEGIKRIVPEEQAGLGPKYVSTLKRASRRRLRKLAAVEYDKLNDQQRTQHNVAASVLGCVEVFTRPKSLEKLTGAVQQATAKLPIGDTLKLFNT